MPTRRTPSDGTEEVPRIGAEAPAARAAAATSPGAPTANARAAGSSDRVARTAYERREPR